jgi:hypothetical protein
MAFIGIGRAKFRRLILRGTTREKQRSKYDIRRTHLEIVRAHRHALISKIQARVRG